MGNSFVHVELTTDDLESAKKFYGSIFGWKLEDMPAMDYTMIGVGKGVGGGMMKKPMPQAPTAWMPYVEVANVNDTLDKARASGANVVVDRKEIGGGMGAFGVFIDPTGAALGVWETAKKAAAPKKKASSKKKSAPKKKKAAKKKGRRR